jgi:hypothetical protein
MNVNPFKVFKCAIPFVVALFIVYFAHIGDEMCVAVLSSSLALYASKAVLWGEQDG